MQGRQNVQISKSLALIATVFVAGIFLSACPGPDCKTNGDCEQGQYCQRELSQDLGQCQSDCDAFWSCPQDSHCTAYGQCQLDIKPPVLEISDPSGEVTGLAGEVFSVVGTVHFLGEQARLTISREDFRGCSPMLPIVVTINGRRDRELSYDFTVPNISLPEGGGILRIKAEVNELSVEATRNLSAGEMCPDCPRIILNTPSSSILDPNLLYTSLAGRVDGAANNALRWQVLGPQGRLLDANLPVDTAGTFVQNAIPLYLGRNVLSVEARNAAGTTSCQRILQSQGRSEDRIFASLTWESANADLDLHIVPPGGQYGLGDCSAALAEEQRFSQCKTSADAQAYGPETLIITNTASAGSYGIIVVPFSGSLGDTAPASLRVLSHNRLIAAMGPRDIDPGQAKLWVLGVVQLEQESQNSSFIPIDQMIDFAPTRPPEDWPEFR